MARPGARGRAACHRGKGSGQTEEQKEAWMWAFAELAIGAALARMLNKLVPCQ